MLTPKLIFSLAAFNPFASIPTVVLFSVKGGVVRGTERKGYFVYLYFFSLYLVNQYLVYLYLIALDFPTSDNPVSENPISGYPVSGSQYRAISVEVLLENSHSFSTPFAVGMLRNRTPFCRG